MSTFSNSLKNIRKRSRITQEQLAGKLNVTRQTVSGWETGRCEPDIGTLMLLAEALDTPVEELIYGRAPLQNAYPRFQRKYLWLAGGCMLALAVYLFYIGVIVPISNMTFEFTWLRRWDFTIRQSSSLLLGTGLMAVLALFFPVHFDRTARKVCLIAGCVGVLPVVLIAAETLLSILILGFRMNCIHFFLPVISNNVGRLFLFSLLPLSSGILLFLGLNRE